MKYLITYSTLFCTIFFAFTSNAQIKIAKTSDLRADLQGLTITENITPSTSISEHTFRVTNISSRTLKLKCRRTEVDMKTGTASATCWGICPPETMAGVTPVLVIGASGIDYEIELATGDYSEGFSVKYKPKNVDGCSLLKFEFFEQTNPSVVVGKMLIRFTHNVSTTCTVSIDENSSQNDILPYPNPSKDGNINIELDVNASLQIFNVFGQHVQSNQLTTGKNTIEILNPGVYYLNIKKGNLSYSRKVVVL